MGWIAARLVALPTEREEPGRSDRNRKDPLMIGDDVVVSRAGAVEFPQLLDAVDDEPPATAILSVSRGQQGVKVRGVSHDNGSIVKVLVNGVEARTVETTAGVVDWSIDLANASAVHEPTPPIPRTATCEVASFSKRRSP